MFRPGQIQQHGFSLLELTIVLAVIGVLGLLANFAFSGADDVRQRQQAKAQAEVIVERMRYFLLTNRRLPCPDTDNDGYENCSPVVEIGTVPYYTIGLPDAQGTGARITYAVYRSNDDNDITTLSERTGDAPQDTDFMGIGDAIFALQQIPGTPVTGHIHTAGINANGNSICTLDAASQPAFILISPLTNKDNDGNLLDGVNAQTGNCFASPLQPLGNDYDDVVVVESPTTLIGWLVQHNN